MLDGMTDLHKPRIIDAEEYARLTQGATLWKVNEYIPSTSAIPDGRIVKLFRPARFWSTRAFRPEARAFIAVAQRLAALGVPAPAITDYLRVVRPPRDVVCYQPVAGESLRKALLACEDGQPLLNDFAGFLAELHEKGVFFRGIHLGNVILTPERAFGLVDFSQAKFYDRPLRVGQRKRNLRHFRTHRKDRGIFDKIAFGPMAEAYLAKASVGAADADALRRAFLRL